MTAADRIAADALARHFAYQSGAWWESTTQQERAQFRARALDIVQIVAPIYQPTEFPRPRGAER